MVGYRYNKPNELELLIDLKRTKLGPITTRSSEEEAPRAMDIYGPDGILIEGYTGEGDTRKRLIEIFGEKLAGKTPIEDLLTPREQKLIEDVEEFARSAAELPDPREQERQLNSLHEIEQLEAIARSALEGAGVN